MVLFSDLQKLGIGLLSFGVAFLFFGVVLFFDSGLLAVGNVLFILGTISFIGPGKSISYFTQPSKIRGLLLFVVGVLLVLGAKRPVSGMIVEVAGIVSLFSDVFPVLLSMAARIPIIGSALTAAVYVFKRK